ncbi:MAG: hypothetical protein HXY41_01190 [Chloroflexi bacterium]|nr:hypothetical protein [Chloroflexota bacterium]
MSVETIPVPVASRFGVTVSNMLLAHDPPADRLLVQLPGKGYTCDYPLLYYLRRAALALGFDVLNVEYGFQAANVELDVENAVYLMDDVWGAARPVLERGYRRVCIAGKSLGTPLAAEMARALQGPDVALILLTPIGGALQGLDDIPTLALIGTNDALYSPEVVAAFDQHPRITWKVYEGLNHSLESGDWRASLAALPDIITACETFMESECA